MMFDPPLHGGKVTRVAIEYNGDMMPLVGLDSQALADFFEERGQSAFRGRQVAKWIYQKGARHLEEMTDLAKRLREDLGAADVFVSGTEVAERLHSPDGTTKYVLRLADGELVEAVRLPFDDRVSACLSSQVGCNVGCPFCATGQTKVRRNLTAGEIVDQYLLMQRESAERMGSVVYMGMGEPLLNYDPVLASIRLLNKEVGVGMRHITLSTSGILPGIRRLMEENLPLNLAISLHSVIPETRDELVPINKAYPLDQLLPACKAYAHSTNRRLTFEVVLLGGINDDLAHAEKMAQALRGIHCHINLIPHNPIGVDRFHAPKPDRLRRFRDVLKAAGYPTTIRETKGQKEAAACGQLRARTP